MRCPSCDFDNASGIKFCGECGSPLKRKCSSCGFENAAGIKFCGGCGQGLGEAAGLSAPPDPRSYTPKHLAEKILTSRSALEGERKQVTVLFADVKGSMDLAEQVDPEEWHRIMDRFFAILSEGVHRFEGTINQFTGDGIMALFGAPIAHEDHAQRACYAALHLTEELRRYADELRVGRGLNFTVRLGLNSGEVVVGRIGDDLRMDYTAHGHTVGLAARMEQLAEPGKPLLTEHTLKLVTGFFAVRDLGPSQVKGATEPLRLYELEGPGRVRSRFEVSLARGLSRFVGRAEEMAVLEAAVERAITGHGQVVGVVAEAGVGKSRLSYEFVERLRARGMPVNEAHGVSHGRTIPLLPVLEHRRNAFDLTEQDSDETARNKIAGRMLRLDPELVESVPVMFEFLGVPDPKAPAVRMTPEAMQREIIEITRRLLIARTRRGEFSASLIEDLHWFDAASEAFFGAMFELWREAPSLVVCTFRPEYRAAWMEKPFYHEVRLLPLGREAIAELLGDLLGTDRSVAGLAEHVRERTAGNPFFIEEVVRALVEAGSLAGTRGAYRLVQRVEELAIPPTVQALLAARIDRLPEREKTVLQTAAVIGKEFDGPLLARVAQIAADDLAGALQKLADAELVFEKAIYPEHEYAFKHPLTQEVAYRSQLGERRKEVHTRVARALEAADVGRLDEQAALLAHHWESAGNALEAARWHRRAAEWAGSRDRAEMMRHLRRVRALLADQPESAETLSLRASACGAILFNSFITGRAIDDAEGIFAEGVDLARRLGDVASLVRLNSHYSMVKGSSGALDDGLPYLTEALRLADESGIPLLRAVVRMPLTNRCWFAGELRRSLAVNEEAQALIAGDPDFGVDVVGFSLAGYFGMARGRELTLLGRFAEAAAELDAAIEFPRSRGETEGLAASHAYRAYLRALQGDARSALAHGREAVEFSERSGSNLFRQIARGAFGQACLLDGQWREAIGMFESALEMMRAEGITLMAEAWHLSGLAEATLAGGDATRALDLAEAALAVARRRQTRIFEIPALLVRVRALRVARGADGAVEIEKALGEATSLVEATEARAYAPFILLERAELSRVRSDMAAWERDLREAQRLFGEMGAPIRAADLAKDLGE